MFGAESIVDREYRNPPFVREVTREAVVRLDVADHPAATVEVQQHGQRQSGRVTAAIEARTDRSAVARGNREIARLDAAAYFEPEALIHVDVPGPHSRDAHPGIERAAAFLRDPQ